MDISLALGGGGARGVAHIGVIRRLEKEGFKIRSVAGTSAGGIVAAVYAAGYSPEKMEAMFSRVNQSRLFGRSPQDGPSILGLAGATRWLKETLGNRTFDDLTIPCGLTAVDLKSGREIVLKEGRVLDAVLATIALPGVFPPQEIKNFQLVDGGVLDPVPVAVARSLARSVPVVAVALTPPLVQHKGISHLPIPVPIPAPIIKRITRLRIAQAFEIFLRSVDVGGRMLTELRLQIDSPDVIIRPDVSEIGLLDRVDVSIIIRAGDIATLAAMPELRRVVSWPYRLRHRWFKLR